MLTELARQVGLALHNVRLDSALQASLDELQLRNVELAGLPRPDRRRRRREPAPHRAQPARRRPAAPRGDGGEARPRPPAVRDRPGTAAALLEELRSDVQTTLTELRELAHGIYPPLLRTRGLPEALRGRRQPGHAADRRLRIGELPRFAADIEAAVYFCCLEAMQNAGKYAGEGRARSP